MATSTEQIVYDESVRAISAQEANLDALRARTGTLLAAASVATAFLGGQVLAHQARLDAGAWIAIGCFALVFFLSLAIVWPWTWEFSVSARILLADHVDVPERNDPGRLYRFLAQAIDEKWDDNDVTLRRCSGVFVSPLSLSHRRS